MVHPRCRSISQIDHRIVESGTKSRITGARIPSVHHDPFLTEYTAHTIG